MLSCARLWDSTDCSPPGSSVQGILQARILEWVAMPSSRGFFPLRDQTCVSCISCTGRQILYHCATWEAPLFITMSQLKKKNLKWLLKKNWILAYFTQRHSTVLRISPLMPLPVLRYWPPKVLLPRSLSSDLFQFADDHPKIVVLRQNIRLQAHANIAEPALSSLPSRIPYFWAMNQDCLNLFDTITEEQ